MPGTARRRSLPVVSWMAGCLVASGILTYAFLVLVARRLPTADYGWFGAYWSLALVIGLGLFLPLEIELTRLVQDAGRRAAPPPGTVGVAAGLSSLSAVAVLAAWPLLSPALGGRTGLLLALLALCALSPVQFLVRGLLMGRGAVRWYGTVLVADTALRVAGVAAIALVVDEPTVQDFGWALVAGIALAHLPVLVVLLRGSRPDAGSGRLDPLPRPRRIAPRALVHLLIGSLCAQTLLNAAPVLVTGAADPGERARAAAFVAGFALVRLPLFVAVPLQSALIRPLTAVRLSGDPRRQHRFVLLLLGAIGAAAVVATGAGAAVGPPLVRLLFGERYEISATVMAVLALGSVLHLGLLVATQSLVAGARHADTGRAWLAGLVTAGLVFTVGPGLTVRAALAFTLGSAVALAWSAVVLLRSSTPVGVQPREEIRDRGGGAR